MKKSYNACDDVNSPQAKTDRPVSSLLTGSLKVSPSASAALLVGILEIVCLLRTIYCDIFSLRIVGCWCHITVPRSTRYCIRSLGACHIWMLWPSANSVWGGWIPWY